MKGYIKQSIEAFILRKLEHSDPYYTQDWKQAHKEFCENTLEE